jgi:hypothetical protein
MAERLVLCGGSRAAASQTENMLYLDLTGPGRNVELRLHDISKRMLTNLPSLAIDLLELAAYVYSADWATSRGREASRRMGAEWRRRFRFVIPVRTPELWSSAPVLDALSETLGFLTDDEYQYEFEKHRGSPPGVQEYLELGDGATARFEPDEVILFSGGLDSLAGVADVVIGQGKRAALVSHHSSTKVVARQRQLVGALREIAPGRLLHFPVLLRKRESLTKEYTLRSRSFVFASLATAIGRMLGKRRILMCENGIVSLNLPIARQLVGARASRTTHPKALMCFDLLFEMLFGESTCVDNPFFWKTKAVLLEDEGGGREARRRSRLLPPARVDDQLHPRLPDEQRAAPLWRVLAVYRSPLRRPGGRARDGGSGEAVSAQASRRRMEGRRAAHPG